MKIAITESQLKIFLQNVVNELDIQKKPMVGKGTEHHIYPSKNNPDRVIKVGKPEIVELWVDIFKNYPEYFPKVFKVGIGKDNKTMFVEVEKLDTQTVIDEWETLEMALDNKFIDTDEGDGVDQLLKDSIVNPKLNSEIKNYLSTRNKSIYHLYIRWNNFLTDVKNILKDKSESFDVHRYNFGYDLDGNIKALDI